jgi:chloride channel 3/4/5
MRAKIPTNGHLTERARKTRGRVTNIPCLFTTSYSEYDGLDLGRAPGEDDEETSEHFFAPTTAGEIQFTPWVNKVRMMLLL